MNIPRVILHLAIICSQLIGIYCFNLNIRWDKSGNDTLERFWTSTGFSPTPSNGNISEFLLLKDEDLNLALISSVPNDGITHVRIHWLLDLISAKCKKKEQWIFNFIDLDTFLLKLYKHQLSVGFEIMGNPSNCFQNITTQRQQWQSFLIQLIQRYIDLFGYEYVKSWRIETMNEPDLKMYNRFNMSLPEYISYTTTTAQVLRGFKLKLWGPAGLFKNKKNHPLCWGLLEYCQTNQCPVDVLSFHKKGDEVSSNVVQRTNELIQEFKRKFPTISDLPMANDESDPLTGWMKPIIWRQDVRYAASVAQIVIGQALSAQTNNYTIAAISNDNGFLSYYPHFWTQRTLFARFQMNNTSPPYVQMFQKPVFAVMTLLSKLGRQLIELKSNFGNPGVSIVSTSDGDRRSVLIVINNDTLTNETYLEDTMSLSIRIRLSNIEKPGRGIIYVVDNTATNPEKIWNDAGKPNFPDRKLRRRIREKETPQMIDFEVEKNETELILNHKVFIPTVLLINLCYENENKYEAINKLDYLNISKNEILLTWDDSNISLLCFKTFIVELRKENWRQFKRISHQEFITTSFHFDGCIKIINGHCKYRSINGEYRIGVIDYWNKKGYYSDSIHI